MKVRPLTKELQQQAEEILNEVPNRTEEDLQHLKEWITKQPHLNVRTDDQWLLVFLRSCKFSLEQTKKKLDFYYTVRTIVPKYFNNRDPLLPEIEDIFRRGVCAALPKLPDPIAPTIIFSRAINMSPDTNTTLAGKAATMLFDLLLCEDDNCTVSGLVVVIDYKNIPFKYAMRYTPLVIKEFKTILQDAYPMRPQKVHVLNLPPFFEATISLAISFLSKKLQSRIHIYNEKNISELYKHIPLSCLPKEYGGHAGPVENIINQTIERLKEHRNWFLEDSSYGSDETKRPGTPITSADLFGVEGSFRKLEID